MGFYPQFVDINQDKICDILSGSYMGKVSLFEGSKDGYKPKTIIRQDSILDYLTNETVYEFNRACFTNPTFGDYNNDGLLDMFLCGTHGVRVSINEGTAKEPYYRNRIPLLDVSGNQVSHVILSESEIEYFKETNNNRLAPDFKTFVLFVDWDNDGVNDLITTSSYSNPKFNAVSFHKGIKMNNDYRFEKPIPLFVSKNKEKALPGEFFVPYICDYDNDGSLDILIGITLPINMDDNTINLELADSFKDNRETKETIGELEERKVKNYGYIILIKGKGRYK